ncbi:unnamed protein product [Choristocarpus tenellus]
MLRPLRCAPSATVVLLRGPYPLRQQAITTSCIDTSTKDVGEGLSSESLTLALSSVLPSMLKDSIVANGLVLMVCGLYRVVVTSIETVNKGNQEVFEMKAAKVCDTTEVQLLAPTISISNMQAKLQERGSLGNRMGRYGLDAKMKADWMMLHATEVTSPIGELEWLQLVGRDFGGSDRVAAAAVGAASTYLKGGRSGMEPGQGCLICGPTGTGKTLLARSVAKCSGLPSFFLDCSSVFRRDRGEAERYLQEFLERAEAHSPSLVVLDQVEAISRKRTEVGGITELQVFSVLLEGMDKLRRSIWSSNRFSAATKTLSSQPISGPRRVFFLCTCPDPGVLDRSLLQRGRLELILSLGGLDEAGRASVLSLHTQDMPLQLRTEVETFKGVEDTAITKEGSSLARGACTLQRTAGGAGHGDRMSGTRVQEAPTGLSAMDADSQGGQRQRLTADWSEGCISDQVTLPISREDFVMSVSRRCHGYVGSDLQRLCREAAMHHMNASMQLGEEGGGVRLEDFWAALDIVRPASLAGHVLWDTSVEAEMATATYSPLFGCEGAMSELCSSLLVPLANPSLLRKLGLRPSTGALLYGPHGCGKTSMARALAREARGLANFLHVQCTDLVDKVVGRSERSVSELFAAARAAAPCILFLDQVEGVAARRGYHSSSEQTFDRILSTLLVEMDGVMSEHSGHVVVLAATVDISWIDPALLRPGRLDQRVYLGPPELSARRSIIHSHLLRMPVHISCPQEEGGGDGAEKRRAGAEGKCRERRVGGETCPGTNQGYHYPEGDGGNGAGQSPSICSSSGDDTAFISLGACAQWLAQETVGRSGADVASACSEAAMASLRDSLQSKFVSRRHFQIALHSLPQQTES